MARKQKPKKPVGAQTLGAAAFKAQCLQIFDRVSENGAEYVVTKHGRPVARVVPVGAPPTSLHGAFAGRIRITGDVLSTGDDWDATS